MKKTFIIILVIIFIFVSCISNYAFAVDPLTASQIGGISIALMKTWGISVAGSAGLTGDVLQNYMENQVNSYVGSRNIEDVFIADVIRVETGRLVLGHQLYNTVKQFIQSWVSDNDIGNIPESTNMISSGTLYGYPVYVSNKVQVTQKAPDIVYPPYYSTLNSQTSEGLCVVTYMSGTRQYAQAYLNGQTLGNPGYISYSEGRRYYAGWTIAHREYETVCSLCMIYVDNSVTPNQGTISRLIQNLPVESGNISVNIGSEGYSIGDDLVTGQYWGGTIEGSPDTNLDQLIGTIFEDAAIDNLIIDTEDPPGPAPTPVPTIEPGDIDGYWNRQADQLEGLGNDIGGLSDDIGNLGKDIGKEAGKVIDSVDGASQGIQDAINSQTGTVSGAIDQAINDVNQAIGDQTQSLSDSIAEQAQTIDQSLTGVKEGIQDIAGKLEPEDIDEKTFDLRELFPFCIPFDIYHLLQKFDGTPAAPHVQLPIVIPSIGFSYMMDLDFSAWDPVAAAMRTVELIVYALGLAWATSKVIKW